MKYRNALNDQTFTFNRRVLIVPGMIAALLAGVACSKGPEQHLAVVPATTTPQLQTVALTSSSAIVSSPTLPAKDTSVNEERKPMPKLASFTSRDFGVSFRYPRQYAFLNARAIARDENRMPLTDGNNSQIGLARIEIPQGYYPDTDFESGYFLLSLNPGLDEKHCQSWVGSSQGVGADSKVIDGTEFRVSEVRNGGRGHASFVRQYATFANSTCYEVELGVTTSNEDGLAREVDHDKVMARLDAILETVKILPTADSVGQAQETSSVSAPVVTQNQ
jgi:hypothetical protein